VRTEAVQQAMRVLRDGVIDEEEEKEIAQVD
jgi:hypothetical protein